VCLVVACLAGEESYLCLVTPVSSSACHAMMQRSNHDAAHQAVRPLCISSILYFIVCSYMVATTARLHGYKKPLAAALCESVVLSRVQASICSPVTVVHVLSLLLGQSAARAGADLTMLVCHSPLGNTVLCSCYICACMIVGMVEVRGDIIFCLCICNLQT